MSKTNTKKGIKKKLTKTRNKMLFSLFWTMIVFICGAYASTHKDEVKEKITGQGKKKS